MNSGDDQLERKTGSANPDASVSRFPRISANQAVELVFLTLVISTVGTIGFLMTGMCAMLISGHI